MILYSPTTQMRGKLFIPFHRRLLTQIIGKQGIKAAKI
jgi:hypothetical protein